VMLHRLNRRINYIVPLIILCVLSLLAAGSPLPQRPFYSDSIVSLAEPIWPSTHARLLHSETSIPLRFRISELRAIEKGEFVELYRRKGHGHPASPSPAKPPPAKPPPPPKKAAPPPKAPPPHGQAPPKKPSLLARTKQHFEHFKEKAKAAFHKIGEGIKTVGLKIAKFAVKAASVVNTWAGKAVGLVCKPLGRAIEGVAAGQGKLADKLNSLDHHQSAKEKKVFHGLDIAAHPMEYAAKAMEKKAEQSGKKGAVVAAKVGGGIMKALL